MMWPAIVAGTAVLLLLANRALVGRETKPPEPAEPGRLLGPAGRELFVVEHGRPAAPPIVLLHGFAGSLSWFDRLVPRLLDEHRVIAVDLLGHGRSAKPDAAYSIEEQGQLVATALAELGCESATVVGHSMGSAVAVAMAEAGGPVSRLVVINEGPDNSYVSTPLIARLGFVPVLGELLHRIVTDSMVRDGYADAFAPGFDLATGFDDPDQVVADFRRMTYSSYARSWAGEDAYLARHRLDERIRALGVPATFVFGARDEFFRAAESAEAFATIPGARVELIEDAGHSPQVEVPDAFAALVRDLSLAA